MDVVEEYNTVLVSVDYDEFKPDSYRGLIVKISGVESTRVYVRDNSLSLQDAFVQNYKSVRADLENVYGDILCTSSFDNFMSDAKMDNSILES